MIEFVLQYIMTQELKETRVSAFRPDSDSNENLYQLEMVANILASDLCKDKELTIEEGLDSLANLLLGATSDFLTASQMSELKSSESYSNVRSAYALNQVLRVVNVLRQIQTRPQETSQDNS